MPFTFSEVLTPLREEGQREKEAGWSGNGERTGGRKAGGKMGERALSAHPEDRRV